MNVVERAINWTLALWWAFVDNTIQRVNALNMTNGRQASSLILVQATGIVYLALAVKWAIIPDTKQWTPDWLWLSFLGVLAGLDIAQFSIKRNTTPEGLIAKRESAEVVKSPEAGQ